MFQFTVQVLAILAVILLVWVVVAWARRKIAGLDESDRADFDEFLAYGKVFGKWASLVIVFLVLLFTAIGGWWL